MRFGKWKRLIALFLVMFLLVGMAEHVVYATEVTTIDEDGSTEDEDTDEEEDVLAVVSNLQVSYDAEKERIVLTYSVSEDTKFVRIYVNGAVDDNEYTGTTYYFEDCQEGQTYLFKVEPYDEFGDAGTAAEKNITVEYQPAVIKEVFAEYDSEEYVLEIDWNAENTAWVDIWLNSMQIGKAIKEDDFTYKTTLNQKQTYTITVYPYNANGTQGAKKVYTFNTGVFEAHLDDWDLSYNENLRRIEMYWEPVNTVFADIYLNDELLVQRYKGKSLIIPCELQPGATYHIEIVPYNLSGEEGESVIEDISFGWFDVPDIDKAKLTTVEVKDSAGLMTGFCKPAASITWEAQKKGIYEIYRATQDKKSAYTWIETVTSDVDGNYTYIDENVEIGTYYYKIRRKIKEDKYTSPVMFSALSDAEKVSIKISKPTVSVEIGDNGVVILDIESNSEFITGYDIYRSDGGKFEKIASISSSTYTDMNVAFGSSYKYKVKSYYYDRKKKTTNYSKFSSVTKVKNMVGEIEAQIEQTAADTIKVSWNAVPNAQGYEIYYMSSARGDSYTMLGITTELEYKKVVGKSGTHHFMIKAYHTTANDQTFFSSAEVSQKMGFDKPRGVRVENTKYYWNATTKSLTQKTILTWNRVYGAAGYYIEKFNPVTKKYEVIAKVKKGKTVSYGITNTVTKGQQAVIYRVSAYNKGMKKKKAGETISVMPTLDKVKGVNLTNKNGKVKVSWKAVKGAEGYRVYRSNGRHSILVGTTSGLSITDAGLVTGVDYTYYVEAYSNTLGLAGEYSDPKVCTGSISKVKGLKVDINTKGKIVLTWKKKDGARNYYIYSSTEKNGTYELVGYTNKLTFIHKQSVEKGTTVYYRVVASVVNIVGAESETKPASTKITI